MTLLDKFESSSNLQEKVHMVCHRVEHTRRMIFQVFPFQLLVDVNNPCSQFNVRSVLLNFRDTHSASVESGRMFRELLPALLFSILVKGYHILEIVAKLLFGDFNVRHDVSEVRVCQKIYDMRGYLTLLHSTFQMYHEEDCKSVVPCEKCPSCIHKAICSGCLGICPGCVKCKDPTHLKGLIQHLKSYVCV